MASEPDYVAINREGWTRANAEYTDARAHDAWAQPEITWGQWRVPESELRVLPELDGKEVIELGCGTAYFGAWLKRLGARRVVGVDITPAQLATARRMDEEFGLGLELIEANAEDVPLPDASFDLAFSEYGASIWCDPELWIAEAARLLRPGGELIFFRGSTLRILCSPDQGPITDRLARPQKEIYKLVWEDDDPGVEFHPGTADMFRILKTNGFELVDLRELFAPDDAVDHEYYTDPAGRVGEALARGRDLVPAQARMSAPAAVTHPARSRLTRVTISRLRSQLGAGRISAPGCGRLLPCQVAERRSAITRSRRSGDSCARREPRTETARRRSAPCCAR